MKAEEYDEESVAALSVDGVICGEMADRLDLLEASLSRLGVAIDRLVVCLVGGAEEPVARSVSAE